MLLSFKLGESGGLGLFGCRSFLLRRAITTVLGIGCKILVGISCRIIGVGTKVEVSCSSFSFLSLSCFSWLHSLVSCLACSHGFNVAVIVFWFVVAVVDVVVARRAAVGIIAVFVVAFFLMVGIIIKVVADHCDIWRCGLVIGVVVIIQSDKLIVEFMKLV